MKLQAIKQVCNRRKHIVLVDTADGEQWIGDGSSLYPVEGIRLSESNIFTVLDIDAKQAKKYRVHVMDTTDPCIATTGQIIERDLLKNVGPAFYHSGCLLYALKGDKGVLFINSDYIKPAERKDGEYKYFLRMTADGQAVVAIYNDMFASALIWPYREYVMDAVRERMEAITKSAGMAWSMPQTYTSGDMQTEINTEDADNG